MAGKRTLVVAAMRSELKPFTRAAAGRSDCVGAVIGIGTALAGASTRRLLDEHPDVDQVLMIGIAGGVGPTIEIGDLVSPEVVLNGSTGAELTPVPLGAVAPRGWLHTSDEFVQDLARLQALEARGVIALDMETAAVGAVCEERGVPWSVLRGISDHVEGLPVDPAVLDLMGPEGEPRLGNVAKYLARNPMRMRHLAKLQAGAKAATTASVAAAMAALG